MKRLHDDADEASSPAAPVLHADYVDDNYDRAESRKRAADNLTLWDHAVTCALVTSTVLLSTILLCLVRQKGRVGAGGRLRVRRQARERNRGPARRLRGGDARAARGLRGDGGAHGPL